VEHQRQAGEGLQARAGAAGQGRQACTGRCELSASKRKCLSCSSRCSPTVHALVLAHLSNSTPSTQTYPCKPFCETPVCAPCARPSHAQACSWLGDRLTGLMRISVGPGDTLLLPSAWPHAVSTPEAALALGGWA